MSSGKPSQPQWVREQLESRYSVTTQVLGPNKGEQQQIKVSNRILTWKDDKGIEYEADPRHVEIIFKQFQFIEAKAATTPGIKDEGRTSEDHNMPFGDKDATSYRAIVARCNYLAPGRPDIAFAVKELARAMANPTRGDQQRPKRLARYFKGKPRLVLQYNWQGMLTIVKTYSDAGWAGCRETRRFTIGGCIKVGARSVKGWSKTHILIALSSGESEFYARKPQLSCQC